MKCKLCGKKLEGHTFDDGSTGLSKDRKCKTCGRLFSDHGVQCGDCGEIFCGDHYAPIIHVCRGKKKLQTAAGLQTRENVPQSGIMILAGIALFILGVWLYIGNKSGTHPTFPFAGFITTTVGFAMMGYGARGTG